MVVYVPVTYYKTKHTSVGVIGGATDRKTVWQM